MTVACPGGIPSSCTLTTDQNSNSSSSSYFLPHSLNGSTKERVATQTAARGLHFERQPEEEMAAREGHRARRVWPDLSGYWLVFRLSVTSISSWDHSVHSLSLCYSLRGRGQTCRIRYCLCHKNGIHGPHSATDRVLSFTILC